MCPHPVVDPKQFLLFLAVMSCARRSLLLFREELLLFPYTSGSGHRPQTVVFLFPSPRVGLVLARGCDPLLGHSALPVLIELVSPTGQLWSVAHLRQLFFRSLFSPHRPFLIKWMLALQDLRPLLICLSQHEISTCLCGHHSQGRRPYTQECSSLVVPRSCRCRMLKNRA